MSWSDLKRKYNGPELSELLAIEYIALGSYKKLGEKYNVSKDCVSTAIKANLEQVKEEKPYLYDLYKYKVKCNQNNSAKRPNKYNTDDIYCKGLKPFESKMFETLPAK